MSEFFFQDSTKKFDLQATACLPSAKRPSLNTRVLKQHHQCMIHTPQVHSFGACESALHGGARSQLPGRPTAQTGLEPRFEASLGNKVRACLKRKKCRKSIIQRLLVITESCIHRCHHELNWTFPPFHTRTDLMQVKERCALRKICSLHSSLWAKPPSAVCSWATVVVMVTTS